MPASEDILSSNFFELFEIPVSYKVDTNKIQQQYMSLQKLVHPDNFVNASDKEKRLSMQRTSWINEAQTTLKDPVLRASYLLKLKGKDFNLENETTMDAAFLMQQLEMRERLESIRGETGKGESGNDETDPLAELDKIAKQVKADTDTMMDGFRLAYENEQLEECREWIRKLQFMKKAKNEIDVLSAEIEDKLMG